MESNETLYRNLSVLVTGGAGFIGSNLIHKLVQLGAKVTVLDSYHESYGANDFNFKGIESSLSVIRGDILNSTIVNEAVQHSDMVFHIAAQCSHVDSMIDPWTDLEFNCKGTLVLLEAVRNSGKKQPVIYAGTRAILGAPMSLPTTEKSLPNPVDIYGVNKHAAELYGAVYARVYGIPFVSLRLTNCYGPRHQMKNGKYGILNWFISLAMQAKPIKIYGTGKQLRDYLFVDDAISAFLLSGQFVENLKAGEFPQVQLAGTKIPYAVFNIGSGVGRPFVECAKEITQILKSPLEFIPWPQDRAAIETGDFIADFKAAQDVLKWSPTVEFNLGLTDTINFYKDSLKYYL